MTQNSESMQPLETNAGELEMDARLLLQSIRLSICGGLAAVVIGCITRDWLLISIGAAFVFFGYRSGFRNFRVSTSYRRFRKTLRRKTLVD